MATQRLRAVGSGYIVVEDRGHGKALQNRGVQRSVMVDTSVFYIPLESETLPNTRKTFATFIVLRSCCRWIDAKDRLVHEGRIGQFVKLAQHPLQCIV